MKEAGQCLFLAPRDRQLLAESDRFATTTDDQAHSVEIGAARRSSPNGNIWSPS
jgi:hypothetical protein